jgi:hypothetical protein
MEDIEKLVDIINDFFGCDAAYFDVNPFDLARHLIDNGVMIMPSKKDIIKKMQETDDVVGDIMKQIMFSSL